MSRGSAPLPPRHPALIATGLVAAVCVVSSVTFLLTDTDLWQHLLVGKAIWSQHHVPTTQLWSWPTHGAPDVNYAWGFEALVWPFWATGGVPGLFVWRWLTTLLAFGLLWSAARRMGARGLSALVVVALGALLYRQRSQVRPETLVAVLMALQIWILETRRHGGPDRTAWLVPIAWVWANVHLTWYLGFILLGSHLLDALPSGANPRALTGGPDPSARSWPAVRRLATIGPAALAISFVNPFGWRALWEPFRFLIHGQDESLYRVISELRPVDWSLNATNGLLPLLIGWTALLAWRARRAGLDRVELVTWAVFTLLALSVQRFVATLALVATPYLARDLDAWIASRRWPAWSAGAFARAALASAACVALSLPDWLRADSRPGIGVAWDRLPVSACDFMAAHDVRGRGLNQFRIGGYMLWRFWPDRERLPFMDIHQAGTPETRRMYLESLQRREAWKALDDRHRFDYALLQRPQTPGDGLLDFLDADTSWALVFVDDAAALYVRREGPMAPLVGHWAYRLLGGGERRITQLATACGADSALRAQARGELQREISGSPQCALAHSFLANLALFEGRPAEAREALMRALAIDAATPRAHERLGMVALMDGQPRVAIAEFERERRRTRPSAGLELRMGMACQGAGELDRARAAYRRVLVLDPGNAHARSLLEEMERGGSP